LVSARHLIADSQLGNVGVSSVAVPVISEMVGWIPHGRVILAMYDPDSQYNQLFVNISAEHLRSAGDLLYLVSSKPPTEIRQQFSELGLNISEYEARDNAVLVDGYSAQMGIKSSEKYQTRAANLNELSITISESAPQWPAGTLIIGESFSTLALHQENVFGKFWRKVVGRWRNQGTILIAGLARGLHPPEFYQEMKLVSDGVLEMRLTEHGGEMINTIRATSMKGQNSDTRWRQILFDDKMKASLRLIE
jgi:KaiC/GvpD/RAD55 family RecA-like ATPase